MINNPQSLTEQLLNLVERQATEMRVILNTLLGKVSKTELPESNVLYFNLENDSWCCVRPSGTEPKIKFYMGIKGDSLEDAEKRIDSLKNAVISSVEN